jgi:hypothetical protein
MGAVLVERLGKESVQFRYSSHSPDLSGDTFFDILKRKYEKQVVEMQFIASRELESK